MRPVRIDVKKSHIKKGMPEDPYCCPVALAIQAKLRGRTFVVFTYGIEDEDSGEQFACPSKVANFIERFDSDEYRKSCKPFSFTLRKSKETLCP